MPFVLSDDEELIRKVVRAFATDQIGLEAAHDMDRHDRFPTEVVRAAAGLGLTGMTVPAEAGGAGITPGAYGIALHELARVCPNTSAVLGSHNGLALRMVLEGQEAARTALLPKLVAGEVAATLMTEEAYGSDKTRIGTEAVPDGDGFRVTGQKVWGLGAAGAAHFLVLANAPGGPAILHVPADADGVQVGANEALLGLRASGIRNVYFNDVAVAPEDVVAAPGTGREAYQRALPWHQVATAAALTGAVAGAFEAARRFAADRVQFGHPIGTYQAVSDAVTEVDIQLAAAESLWLRAAARLLEEDGAVWAARAKAFAAQMAVPMTRKVIRIQGGTGFMRDGGTERFARDVRALQFVAEPEAVQRDIVKRAVLDIAFGPTP